MTHTVTIRLGGYNVDEDRFAYVEIEGFAYIKPKFQKQIVDTINADYKEFKKRG